MLERLKELNHIGIAVNDLDEAKKLYCNILGFKLMDEKELPDRGLKIAFLSTGNTKIELLEGTTAESTITRFVASRGPGIHHLCFEVDDITKTLAELSADGIDLIDRAPRDGAEGHPVAFLHPGSTMKVLIELEEK